VIEDVSDYQFRRPQSTDPDCQQALLTTRGQPSHDPVTIRGRPHIISTNEPGGASGAGGWRLRVPGSVPVCYPNIIDVTDENEPKIIASSGWK